MSSEADDNPLELQVEKALAEYLHKCDTGEMQDREAFLSQHPEFREQLAELLSAADWIEQMAGPTVADLAKAGAPPAADGADWIEETLPLGSNSVSPTQNTLPLISGSPTGEFSLGAKQRDLSQPVLPCRFGDYVLERVLGRGGMGVVYFGHQVRLERPVAIKMIRSGALASDEEVQRFFTEARSAARLDHPNIVTVYQCGECDGHSYFSMDYVAGTDLARMTADGPLDCKRAARYVRDTARAIQYAHDRGILHRDLKPANVLVDEDDEVRITDFGLAKSIGNESGLTAEGAALGTPSYMSPEQAAGRIDEQHHATDVYSLGAVLFTITTGQPPFKAGSVLQTIMQVIHRPAPRARSIREDVPEDLETVIDVCLQKSPERRYASAGALADELDRFLRGSPIQARPASHLRRCWYWLLGVPIVGAVLDHRVVEPTDAHRWVQRGLISLALLVVLLWMAMLLPTSTWYRNRMPDTVRVAAGSVGGNYDKLAKTICQILRDKTETQAIPITSAGSNDNVDKLERGEVDFALVQADAVSSSHVAVVAPLYYEAVHILVKADSSIHSVADLSNHRVILGSEKSGSWSVSRLLLNRAGLTLQDLTIDNTDWRSLAETPEVDAAIVVTKPGTDDIIHILSQGHYRVLSLSDSLEFALDEPAFHPLLLTSVNYPDCGMPEAGIATVATTAFLAAQFETPAILVQTVLQNLFDPQVVQSAGILSAEKAAHFHGLAWHPAAHEFFQAYRGSSVRK